MRCRASTQVPDCPAPAFGPAHVPSLCPPVECAGQRRATLAPVTERRYGALYSSARRRVLVRHDWETNVPKIDKAQAPRDSGTRYPAPFDKPCRNRAWRRLGDAAGLTQFGVNLLRLPPGALSSQRHWHSHEDEFVYVLNGDVVLVTDAGEEILRAGDCAGFKAGDRNGHCLQNRTLRDAEVLIIGSRSDEDQAAYPDIDLERTAGRYSGRGAYRHKDGSPY